jgi:uncharacterized protein with FMN-binding domain
MESKAKKVLLSLGFLAVFGVYAIYERNFSSLGTSQITTTLVAPTNSVPQTTTPPPSGKMIGGKYKNGQYTGSSVNVFYGIVQVQAVIGGGQLTDVKFLSYPQDNRNSLSRSNYALPQLKTEAIQAQGANVNMVSGATETSSGFIQSLSSALSQAS